MTEIVLDTNLAVLAMLGSADRSYIGRHTRLAAYSEEDFDLLVQLLSSAKTVKITPNVATEVSNLTRQSGNRGDGRIPAILGAFLQKAEEKYVQSRDACQRAEFAWLGLTDAALLEVLSEHNKLLTADSHLHIAACKAGFKSENFNHYREANWGI